MLYSNFYKGKHKFGFFAASAKLEVKNIAKSKLLIVCYNKDKET